MPSWRCQQHYVGSAGWLQQPLLSKHATANPALQMLPGKTDVEHDLIGLRTVSGDLGLVPEPLMKAGTPFLAGRACYTPFPGEQTWGH